MIGSPTSDRRDNAVTPFSSSPRAPVAPNAPTVLQAAGILPSARFAVMHAVAGWTDSLDMTDVLHPQTILAYGMNGRDVPVPHGAPVRLRVEREIGSKSMKYVRRIVVTDTFDDGGANGNIQNGWAWYNGI